MNSALLQRCNLAMCNRIILAIGLVTLATSSATAQWEPKPQINVSGSAELKVAPDEVDLRVGVETRNEVLDGARTGNDERIARALDFLKRAGVKENDVQTDYITVEPKYDEYANVSPTTGLLLTNPDKQRIVEPLFYIVRKSIGVKLRNTANFDKVLTGLMTNGVNRVLRVDFQTSELRKYQDQARTAAVRVAKEKAQAMAAELGVKVGKPYNISANDWSAWNGWTPPGSWTYGGVGGVGGGGFGGGGGAVSQNTGEGTTMTVAVGKITISANVNVSFLIE